MEIELFSVDLAFGPLLLSPVTTVLTRLAKVFPGWPIRGRQCQGSPLNTPTPLGVRGSAVWVGALFERPQPPHTLHSPL